MMDTGSNREMGAGYAVAAGGEGMPPRRQYALELKRQVVEETFAPGASVSIVARRHDLNANLVFEWRKQYRHGKLWNGQALPPTKRVTAPAEAARRALPGPDLIRVGVIDDSGSLRPVSGTPSAVPSSAREASTPESHVIPESGIIEIELPNRVKVRVDSRIDEAVLRRLLAAAKEIT